MKQDYQMYIATRCFRADDGETWRAGDVMVMPKARGSWFMRYGCLAPYTLPEPPSVESAVVEPAENAAPVVEAETATESRPAHEYRGQKRRRR